MESTKASPSKSFLDHLLQIFVDEEQQRKQSNPAASIPLSRDRETIVLDEPILSTNNNNNNNHSNNNTSNNNNTSTSQQQQPLQQQLRSKDPFNLMYFWFAGLVVLQFSTFHMLLHSEYGQAQLYMSTFIYMMLMGYFYIFQRVTEFSFGVKVGVSLYFGLVWWVLSYILCL